LYYIIRKRNSKSIKVISTSYRNLVKSVSSPCL